ncbi:MAG: hypothetical protein CL992_01510 [Euryarchaeota archaeon]|nr:hypothetical protein [Euryarchaeota archaeon]
MLFQSSMAEGPIGNSDPLWLKMRRVCSPEGDLRGNGEAVSPVIATVLLLAITVSLSSVIFLLVSENFQSVEKRPVNGRVTLQVVEDRYHVIRIVSLDEPLSPYTVQWRLTRLDVTGDNLTSFSGTVEQSDVYNQVGTPITYQDVDAAFSVNVGDYFVIDAEQTGLDEGDWEFIVFETLSESTVARISIQDST